MPIDSAALPPVSRRQFAKLGIASLLLPGSGLVGFDPAAYGMVQTLGEEFDGDLGSWWQDNGGRFSPTVRYFSATPNSVHPLGQDAQFMNAAEKQVFTWEGDPNNPGVSLFSKHPTNPSVMRMTARRAGSSYPKALKPWLAPCLESSNGPIWLRANSNSYLPGDGRGHEQRYGYWEVRCSIPETAGTLLWPAWWLYGANAAEIDVFERVGSEFTNNARFRPSNSNLEQWNLGFDPSGMHVWSVLWTPDNIIFLCDGTEYRTVAVAPNYAYYGPLFMIFSLGIGGTWPESAPNNGTDAATPAHPILDVDYIRVWQFPDFITT